MLKLSSWIDGQHPARAQETNSADRVRKVYRNFSSFCPSRLVVILALTGGG